MLHIRRSLLLLAAIFITSSIYSLEEISENDLQSLREFINTKRQVTVKELGGALSIAGEVRAEYQTNDERRNGERLRGPRSNTLTHDQSFDIEVNLMLDYRSDRTWASIKLEFDNAAGSISGTEAGVDLERAYFGARAYQGNSFSMDVEIGRRSMGQIVDSKIEFDSRFDGIWLKFDKAIQSIGDFYTHVGAFVINERKNQFGYLGEFGLLNIVGSGLYTKYSIVDWNTKDFKDPIEKDRFNFIVSQFIAGYKFIPGKFQKIVLMYAAVLVNHMAKEVAITNYKKENIGGYAGFSIGQLKKRNDWAWDSNYQIVQAQAVPDFDSSGIGLGNSPKSGFYTKNVGGTGGPNTIKNAGGNVNFQGYSLQFDYLLSDNLLLSQAWVQSWTLDKDIGPDRNFKQYEIEFIYAF